MTDDNLELSSREPSSSQLDSTLPHHRDSRLHDKEGWFQTVDPNTGRTYFVNRLSRESTWHRPLCFPPNEKIARVPQRMKWSDADGSPDIWREQLDAKSGRVYYFNKDTREVSWIKPIGYGKGGGTHGRSPSVDSLQALETRKALALSKRQSHRIEQTSVIEENDLQVQLLVDSEEDDELAVEWSSELSDTDDVEDLEELMDEDEEGAEEENAGAEESELGQFTFAQHRKGFLNRVLHRGAAQDEKRLLTFKKSMIKKSILKKNRRFDGEAIQFFKNLMGYMGDYTRTSKSPEGHAQKLVFNGLMAPDSLKDEIFLQVCKQVNGHPNIDNCIRGWEMLVILLGAFCPSKNMRSFLKDFVERHTDDSKVDQTVQRLAKTCLVRLNVTYRMGQRAAAPSVEEILRDREGKPVRLQIHCMDGVVVEQDVDVFTTIRTVWKRIIRKRRIQYYRLFNLYQVDSEGEEDIFEVDSRILDVYSRWEEMSENTGRTFRFVFKEEIMVSLKDRKLLRDPVAFDLQFHQAVADIVQSKYPLDPLVVPTLCALYLCAMDGPFEDARHSDDAVLLERIAEIAPKKYLQDLRKGGKEGKLKLAEICQKTKLKFVSLGQLKPLMAKKQFLHTVEAFELFGSIFIEVEQKQLKGYPSIIWIAVNTGGIRLVNPKNWAVLDMFTFDQVLFWDNSDEKFVLGVGSNIEQRKLFLSTQKGMFLNHIVTQYVSLYQKYNE